MERKRFKDGLYAGFFTEERMCGQFFPVCEVTYSPLEPNDYAKRVLSDKPVEIQNDDYLNQLYSKIEEEGRSGQKISTYRVLQISDWHLDLDYKTGTKTKDCGSFCCCEAESGVDLLNGARKFGE